MTVSTWNLQPPPGFQGLREELPLHVYWRHLPHWRQDGATYFVTFRLADSLPQSKLRELEEIKREWAIKHGICRTDCQSVLRSARRQSVPRRTDCQSVLQRDIPRENWEAFARAVMVKAEAWLDNGMGECWMARPEVARIVAQAVHHFDNDQYELGCYVVMPNHVHAILRPLRQQILPLEKILQSRKRRTSREINAVVGRSGLLWQEESFDRIIRDEEHLYRCIQYIGSNLAKAGMPPGQGLRWVRPEWEELGWRFNDA
jgi:REP element-mobilizing transposase RayT